MTLVLEDAPQLPTHGGAIAPVPEAPPDSPASSDGFERGQILATNQMTIMQQREQDQEVGSQMGQFARAAFILLPALEDVRVVGTHALLPPVKM